MNWTDLNHLAAETADALVQSLAWAAGRAVDDHLLRSLRDHAAPFIQQAEETERLAAGSFLWSIESEEDGSLSVDVRANPRGLPLSSAELLAVLEESGCQRPAELLADPSMALDHRIPCATPGADEHRFCGMCPQHDQPRAICGCIAPRQA